MTVLAVLGLAHAEQPRNTLTAVTGAPLFVGMTYEHALVATENVEVALGVQVQADVVNGQNYPDFFARPFLVAGYYVGTGSVWFELSLPENAYVPGLGQGSYWFTVSTQYRW
ncbi:MAG: hypothetical protein LC650_04965 [Actinobacteria bacterium]|nr:hypothetical protein [Actinomycetota bacterium]